MARIAFHLRHPVANRLGRRLELLREIVGTTPCAHQLHHSAPVFRRIPCMTLGHRGSPSLSPLRHCPPNRVNSKVQAELFEIGADDEKARDLLRALDRYEEYDPKDPQASMYIRRFVMVKPGSDGGSKCQKVGAWVYIYNRAFDRKTSIRITSGDWRLYKHAQT